MPNDDLDLGEPRPAELVFEWDEANLDHLMRHAVDQDDVEQVIVNRPVDIETQVRSGEERFVQIGETDLGRILIVVTTRPSAGLIRVVTAWPAKERFRRYFITHKETGNAGRA